MPHRPEGDPEEEGANHDLTGHFLLTCSLDRTTKTRWIEAGERALSCPSPTFATRCKFWQFFGFCDPGSRINKGRWFGNACYERLLFSRVKNFSQKSWAVRFCAVRPD